MPNFTKSKGFQLKSGNTAKAPFKMMGSSPLEMHKKGHKPGDDTKSESSFGDFGKDKTNEVDAKRKTIRATADGKSKVNMQKLELEEPSKKTKKLIKEDKANIDKQAKEVGKPKKEGKEGTWLGRITKKYKAYRDSDKFKENDAAIQDFAAALDPTGRKKGGKEIRDRLDKKATIKKSDIFAKSEAEKQSSKETRDIEMHESKLAMNQSLTDKRNKVAQEDQENSLTTENETSLEPTVKFGVDWNKLSL
jgi:hypothetical protein